MKKNLPIQLANISTRHFVDSFKKQGWTDGVLQKWPEVQRRKHGTGSYMYPKKKDLGRRKRMILTGKSGGTKGGSHAHLRQSVNTSMKTATWDQILFSVPQPYAKAHNDGLKSGRFTQKQRKFMGNSKQNIAKMKHRINKAMTKILATSV